MSGEEATREPRKLLPRGVTTAGLVILALLIGLQLAKIARGEALPFDDFAEYWGAGRLTLQQGNPYSPEQMLQLQKELNPDLKLLRMMYNPPWVVPLVLPFSLLDYQLARTLWLALHFTLLIFSADLLWRLYRQSHQDRWLAMLLVFAFIPALYALRMGQISIFMLLGAAAFLHFEARDQRWLAGVSLALMTIKPQLYPILWLLLLLWSCRTRCWRILAGLSLTLTAGIAIAYAVNPHILTDYLQIALTGPPLHFVPPTLGSALRLILGEQYLWLQFLFPILGVLWALLYWKQNYKHWHWQEQMPLILLVSMFTAAYGWEYDLVVLLVPILQAAVWIKHAAVANLGRRSLVLYLLVNLLTLSINLVRISAFWFVWLPAVSLLIYLWIRSHMERSNAVVSTK